MVRQRVTDFFFRSSDFIEVSARAAFHPAWHQCCAIGRSTPFLCGQLTTPARLEKENVMQRSVILASVMVLAVASANCGNSDRNVLSPSATSDAAAKSSSKGGGGGKPSGGGTTSGNGSLTLVMVNDVNGNGLPNWGDSIRFNVSTTATTQPQVSLTCSQNGTVVSKSTTGYWEGYLWPWTQTMTLSSMVWTSGGADCLAQLYYSLDGSRINYLSSLSFVVAP
jgi:hypothetical protein